MRPTLVWGSEAVGDLESDLFRYVTIVSVVFVFYLFICDRKSCDRWASPLLFFCLLVSLGVPLVIGINAKAGVAHVIAHAPSSTMAITIVFFPILLLYVPVLIAMRIGELNDRVKLYVSAPFFALQLIYFYLAVNYGKID